MQVSVLQFRGIDKAEFTLADIVLLAGPNGAGKSSICIAVAAALAGQPIPILRVSDKGKIAPILTKSEAGRMVRVGYDMGGARVRDGEDEVSVVWPGCDLKSKGTPPVISVYAAGLISILDLSPREQIKALSDLMGAIPTEDDIQGAFESAGMSQERIAGLIDRIRMNGWDAVHEAGREHGAKLKGQWETYAGESYGSQKGAGWIPPGWEVVLSETADATLSEHLAMAKQALEKRLQDDAVNTSVVAELQDRANEIPGLEASLGVIVQAVTTAEAELSVRDKTLKDAVAKLPRDGQTAGSMQEPWKCPHCKKPVAFDNGALIKAVVPVKAAEPDAKAVAALEALREEVREASSALKSQTESVSAAEREQMRLQLLLGQARAAAAKLSDIAARPPADTRPVDAFRDEVRLCEARIEAKRKKEGADRAHKAVQENQAYIDLLAPGGMRKRKLLRALDDFNAKMAEMCTTAGYKLVTVDEEMQIRYGERNYYLLSGSEQYRVRAIMQLAAAFSDNSAVVVLDGADILDSAGRNGLFALLGNLDIIALVGMTMNKPEQAPDLGKFAIGQTLWVAGGTARPVQELIEEK